MATKQKPKQPKPKPQGKKPAAKAPQKKKAAKPSPPAAKKKAAPPPKPAPKKKAAAPKAAAPKPPAKAAAKAAPSPTPSPSPIQPSKAPSTAPSRSIPTPSAVSPTEGGGTRYLSVADLVELHRAVSLEFGGNQAQPGVVESQFGLLNAVQRPQVTMLGREAYSTFPDKVAAFLFALLINSPFNGGNRRVALASLFAFCELNNRTVDSRLLDEKAAENLFKRAAGHRELGIPPENVFREIRETMTRAIMPLS